ncbi:MAG: hypothetical protein ACD_39C01272G0001 [uncultured bacterium]|nr:MAG: hypothetical protein ACD_39C01272G0001 [uncultured bacterium]
MKRFFGLLLSVALLVVVSAVAGHAGTDIGRWTDWVKADKLNLEYRVRCNGLGEQPNVYFWDVEVSNKSADTAKFGVNLTPTGLDVEPEAGWRTWPIGGNRGHKFVGFRSEAAPGQKVKIWLKNLSSDKKDVVTGYQTAGKLDSVEGTVFNALNMTWMVGKADLDWNQTQEWIKSLGLGWRSPTKDELVMLFKEVDQKSPLGQDYVWAEPRDAHSAWHFSFYYREVRWSYFDDHSRYGRGVAVRPISR